MVAVLTGRGRGAAAEIEADPDPEVPQLDDLVEVIDVSDIEFSQTLPGHGFGPDKGSVSTAPAPSASPAPAADAVVTLTVNTPNETDRPEADIAAAHSRPGAAGWTTPSYAVAVTSARSNRVAINVTLDFEMELASEYTGDRRAVLRDHEFGHVEIGKNVARADLVNGLEATLESFSSFNRTNIQSSLTTAASSFVTNEGNKSAAYDATDYPRMREAYLGVRTSVDDLAAASPAIAQLQRTMKGFAEADATALNASMVRQAASELRQAWDGLSDVDAARVQYNPGFKTLVADCERQVDDLLRAFESDDLEESTTTQDVAVRGLLEDIQRTLAKFEWQPSV